LRISSPVAEWSNEQWLAALGADRESAWQALRERVMTGLLGYLRTHRGSEFKDREAEGLAEDAVQETLRIVRAKLDEFRNESRFTTWVYRIAVNAMLGEIRRLRWERRAPTDVSAAVLDSAPVEAADPERSALQRELWTLVCKLIDDVLTPYQRGVLVDHVFREKPLDLVAGDLGVSRDAVYKAIHDARRKLRVALLAQGVSPAEAVRVFAK
jgi:RNA polymerase sigma-70 factor (ECF subfamily)